jgi:transglutaminase-like putative cysteine protease
MMQVNMKGVAPTLWRGRVYERYTANRWESIEKSTVTTEVDELNATPITIPDPETEQALPPVSRSLVREGDVIEALLEPEEAPFRNLFFPGRPEGVYISQDISHLFVDPDGVVTLPGSYYRMVWPYNIKARLTEENPAALLAAPGFTPRALKQWRNDPATSATLELLPDRQTARDRIQAIAAEIQRNAAANGRPLLTPYEKGIAVREYLVSHCTYSLAAPQVPLNEEAVVFFLTTSHQGACDMFASAAALLLRAMDVPARLATGYLATESADSSSAADAGAAGAGANVKFPLRERDAHAWIEYYIPRAGWLTMDPTEGTRTTEVPIQAQLAHLLRLPELNISWQMLILPAIGIGLLMTGIFWPMLSRRGDGLLAATPEDIERRRIAEAYRRAVRLLRRRVPHRAHYTPREYEAAVSASSLPLPAQQEFAALTYLSVAARYATTPPTVAQIDLDQCLKRLRQGLK